MELENSTEKSASSNKPEPSDDDLDWMQEAIMERERNKKLREKREPILRKLYARLITFSFIFFLALFITLCCLGWLPTGAYLQANRHLDKAENQNYTFAEFGPRQNLICETSPTIGMILTIYSHFPC